jgi:hypothetical protein
MGSIANHHRDAIKQANDKAQWCYKSWNLVMWTCCKEIQAIVNKMLYGVDWSGTF